MKTNENKWFSLICIGFHCFFIGFHCFFNGFSSSQPGGGPMSSECTEMAQEQSDPS